MICMHFKPGDMICPGEKFSQVHSIISTEVGLILELLDGGYKVLFRDGEVCNISSDYARACYRRVEV